MKITHADFIVLDNVIRPVGVILMMEYATKQCIRFFNKNGYIVVISGVGHKSAQDILQVTRTIKTMYHLPLVLIYTPNETNSVSELAPHDDLYSAIISVDNMRKTRSVRSMIKLLWHGLHPKIQHHVPLMIVNSDINPVCSNGRLARCLYNAYSMYDATKLVVMLYPGINYENLWTDDTRNFKYDVLHFLTDIHNKH